MFGFDSVVCVNRICFGVKWLGLVVLVCGWVWKKVIWKLRLWLFFVFSSLVMYYYLVWNVGCVLWFVGNWSVMLGWMMG